MVDALLRGLQSFARRLGVEVRRSRPAGDAPLPADIDAPATATIRAVRPYTMTSPERLFALIQAVRYVSRASIPGDIVECGVWRGGSMMAAARTLIECGDTARNLYLFDTFEGMTQPTDRDVAVDGSSASALLESQSKDQPDSAWCYASIEDVAAAMSLTGYARDRVRFVKGSVADTLPREAPRAISILRLDTDWYESTRHELEHLYPRLSAGGVLIIDDYGHWKGARQAVDEYVAGSGARLLLNRIDYTGRIAVKIQ